MQCSEMLAPFTQTLQKTDEWMHHLMNELGIHEAQKAYRVLRSTLHALRDRLTPVEAAHLAAQLPMLIRGLYYEGWNPAHMPVRMDREAFIARVASELQATDYDPQQAIRTVFRVLQQRVSEGEIRDIRGMMPSDLDALWSAAA